MSFDLPATGIVTAQQRSHSRSALTAWIPLLLVTAFIAGIGALVASHHHPDASVAVTPQAPAASQPIPVKAAWPSGSGVYAGAGNGDGAIKFGHWRGAKVAFAEDYLSTDNWHDIAVPTWWLRQWRAARLPLVLAVPMLPDSHRATLAAGAHGHYDRYFRTLARNMVRFGDRSASLRIGWEMNGNWYRWSAIGHPDRWIAYYRHIVSSMRSVRGANFNFNWNPNLGYTGISPVAVYPGDRYVDSIGMDVYDWKWNDPTATPQVRWDNIVNRSYGLSWLARFGIEHGKPVTLPEWSLAPKTANANGGGGDDPLFIRNIVAWAAAHHVQYEAYFNFGPYKLRHYPHAKVVYRSLKHTP